MRLLLSRSLDPLPVDISVEDIDAKQVRIRTEEKFKYICNIHILPLGELLLSTVDSVIIRKCNGQQPKIHCVLSYRRNPFA